LLVLVINCGSSSLKYELFDATEETSLASGLADRVGIGGGGDAKLTYRPSSGDAIERSVPIPDHRVAVALVIEALTDPEHGVIESLSDIGAIGHRVVHGGEQFTESVWITPEVIQAVEKFSELAPLHNPANLIGIRACQELFPGVPNVAVFDTAFHQTMPQHSYLYGIPYEVYEDLGVRRYGFHGTSHRYVAELGGKMLLERGVAAEEQKIVTCHLGNGCSMAAVKGGRSVDTTLGFTPLEGLLMGTRCGDLDPALVPFLMDRLGLDLREIDVFLNKKSGLLGVSGVGSDMRDVRAAAEKGNKRAQAALDLFCYRVRKYIGAYAAAMGGIHAVVFTAGIGENDPVVRARCVEGLEFLGLAIDEGRNADPAICGAVADISAPGASAWVFVIPTDEELLIARDTAALLLPAARRG